MSTNQVSDHNKAASINNSRANIGSTSSKGDLSSDSAGRAVSKSSDSTVTRVVPTIHTSTISTRSTISATSLHSSQKMDATNNTATADIDAPSFKAFHKLVYQTIDHWTKQPGTAQHSFYAIWKTKWKDIIKEGQTFSGVKKSLKTTNLRGYYDFIMQCPLIIQLLAPKFDTKMNIITYLPLPIVPNETTPSAASENLTATSPPTLVPNVVINNDVIPNVDGPYYETTQNNKSSFSSLHSAVWNTLTQWSKTKDAQPSTYYDRWIQLEGLISETSSFQAVSHWMNLTTIEDYCEEVLHWPDIMTHYDIKWDPDTQSIKWRPHLHHIKHSDATAQVHKLTDTGHESSSEALFTIVDDTGVDNMILDLQDEFDSSSPARNRFIHFIQDKINATMGQWGHYMKQAEHQVKETYANIDTKLHAMEDRVTKFHDLWSSTSTRLSSTVAELDGKVDFHISKMHERADTQMLRIDQWSARAQQQLEQHGASYSKQVHDDMEQHLQQAVKEALDLHLKPIINTYVSELENCALQMLVNLEDTYADYTTQLSQHAEQERKAMLNNHGITAPRPTSSIYNKPVAPRFAHITHP
jgi:hypothetical protein